MNDQAILLKNVLILDSQSPFHGKRLDVSLQNGRILNIDRSLSHSSPTIIEGQNLHLSLGWVDLRANFNDPGHEDRETLSSGATAALHGGYTAVGLSPESHPVVDTKSAVEYLRSNGKTLATELLPIASFSKGLAGQDLSELFDMRSAGAQAFSHGSKAVTNAALMKLALLYQREMPEALQVLSKDPSMAAGGQMHEGAKSTWLGLKGIPDLAETLSISRDISLAQYCNSAIHFQGISAAKSVELISQAQKDGLKVSADVNLLNLIYTDQALETYDSNLKLYPPLREEKDREALLKGLKSGVITGIASDHHPNTIEEKRCEFDLAEFGAASIEGSFACLNTHLGEELGLELIIEILSRRNREILNYQTSAAIDINARVDLTLFDPSIEWAWDKYRAKSKAANYPFKGQSFKGRALGTFSRGQWRYCDL